MKCVTLTNNPNFLDCAELGDIPPVEFVDGDSLCVLQKAALMVENGFHLVTHPLSANNRLNKSPYRSLILSDEKTWSGDDVKLLEQAISHIALQVISFPNSDYRWIDFEHLKTAASEIKKEEIKNVRKT